MIKTIVIGAGPAGIFAGITSTKKGNKTIILEGNKSPGKKLLISGSGQCNFTHSGDLNEFSNHYGMRKKQALRFLRKYDNKRFLEFLDDNKFQYFQREDGKYFPKSKKSIDMLNLLLKVFNQHDGKMHTAQKVLEIAKVNDSFKVKTAEKVYSAEKVIIASGGITFPATGSDGSMFTIIRKLGCRVNEPFFGLSPVYAEFFDLSELAGISFKKAGIKIINDDQKSIRKKGEMLITHKGFSGPLIIDNSRYMKKGCQLEINFTGFDSSETFNEQFIKHSERNGKILLKNFLGKFDLPRRLVEKLLKQNCIDENTRLSQLNKIVRKQIVRSFTAYPVKVKKIGGINESMITVGGIDLDDVNLSTMESKSIRGLYFCGEVLDIDGDTGGYNIQLAISTGFIAGNAQ